MSRRQVCWAQPAVGTSLQSACLTITRRKKSLDPNTPNFQEGNFAAWTPHTAACDHRWLCPPSTQETMHWDVHYVHPLICMTSCLDATCQLSTRSTRALESLGRSLSAAYLLAPGHRRIWTTATSQLGCLTPACATIGRPTDRQLRRANAGICTAQLHSWIKGLKCSLRVLLTHSLSSGLRQLHLWSTWAHVATLS